MDPLVSMTMRERFGGLARHRSAGFIALFSLLGLGICGLIENTETEPGPARFALTSWENDSLMGMIAGATAVALFIAMLVTRWNPDVSPGVKRAATRTAKGITIVGLIFAALVYFYSGRALTKPHYPKFWDSYHYLLGAKYFPELGYTGLYDCHVVADAERRRPRFRPNDKIRDLENYEYIRVRKARARADCSRFSAARWAEFSADLDTFDRYNPDGSGVLGDHGYNGAPFHAVVAGNLADLPELSYPNIVRLTYLDVLALSLMLSVAAWAFGWQIATLFALFLFTNFADRFNYIGASYFRYIWLVCLVIGLGLLHKRRYGPSAVFMVAAAMLNVFPLLYFAGIGFKILWTAIRERRIEAVHKTFVKWAVAATLAFGSISMLHPEPVENYRTFLADMEMHSPLLTRSRIGFRYDFVFSGQTREDEPRVSYEDKQADLDRMQTGYRALVAMILLFGLAVVVKLGDLEATILAGFLLFFVLFSTVEYYYASAAVLVLFWAGKEHTARARAFLALLFAMMAGVYVAWNETGFLGFCNNHMMSWLFTTYLGALLLALALRKNRDAEHA